MQLSSMTTHLAHFQQLISSLGTGKCVGAWHCMCQPKVTGVRPPRVIPDGRLGVSAGRDKVLSLIRDRWAVICISQHCKWFVPPPPSLRRTVCVGAGEKLCFLLMAVVSVLWECK